MKFRAIENPVTELMVDPVATNLVLGTPHPRSYPGEKILPRLATDWKFRFWTWDNSHLKARDTKRPLGAPIKYDSFHSTSDVDQLERYSWMSLRDDDEFNIADSQLALQEKHGVYARMVVESHLERVRRDAILNAAYPSGHVITLASGDEFNSPTGGSLEPIQAGLNLIASKTGWEWGQIKVFLPYPSYLAAITDPVFRANRLYTAGTKNPGVADLQAYWGCGEVWTMNTIEANEAGDISQMWGDVAILYGDGVAPEMSTEFGFPVFGRSFGWKKSGVANVPQRLPLPLTVTAYPWTDYLRPRVLVPAAGVKILNCAL